MNESSPAEIRLAEAVRAACVHTAVDAFEAAAISGLCCTGAWECAVGAVRTLDLDEVVRTALGRRPVTDRPHDPDAA